MAQDDWIVLAIFGGALFGLTFMVGECVLWAFGQMKPLICYVW